jgi:hypothetical protein
MHYAQHLLPWIEQLLPQLSPLIIGMLAFTIGLLPIWKRSSERHSIHDRENVEHAV